MWQTSEPCYSEKAVLKMLKEAPMKKLMEYLLMKTRRGQKMANEKRLIDANALMDSFCQACSTNKRYKMTDAECRSKRDSYGNGCFKMRLIENAPTVSAVEVCRCKDCKHYYYSAYAMRCVCDFDNKEWDKDDFCSYGERRTNEPEKPV